MSFYHSSTDNDGLWDTPTEKPVSLKKALLTTVACATILPLTMITFFTMNSIWSHRLDNLQGEVNRYVLATGNGTIRDLNTGEALEGEALRAIRPGSLEQQALLGCLKSGRCKASLSKPADDVR